MLLETSENDYTNGLYFLSLGLLNRALLSFLSSIEKGSNIPDAYNNAASIMMYKGRFSEAFGLLKINWAKNKDKDAAELLNSIHDINAFIKNYNAAIDFIGESKYKDALDLLDREAVQGYRIEDGDILRCLLYYLQGNFNKSKSILNEIHEVDRECEFYLRMSRVLDSKKGSFEWQKAVIAALAAVTIISNSYLVFELRKKPKEVIKYQTIEKPVAQAKEEKTVEMPKESYAQVILNLYKLLSAGNYYEFEKEKASLDVSKLDAENKKNFDSLDSTFKKNAESYFYNNGLSFFKDKNYTKALEYFQIAYKYKTGSYLDQHVVFMTAKLLNYNKSKDAEKYYLEYINTYKDGCYMGEALYDIMMFYYNSGNLSLAKKYAAIIMSNFKDTQYNNGIVKSIAAK